ncbi:MAG: hypothetical protein HY075_08675 [Deltaproteobacteria bacterium]|nr:hypothetical protein [Deltaproteobacteria bacterium]
MGVGLLEHAPDVVGVDVVEEVEAGRVDRREGAHDRLRSESGPADAEVQERVDLRDARGKLRLDLRELAVPERLRGQVEEAGAIGVHVSEKRLQRRPAGVAVGLRMHDVLELCLDECHVISWFRCCGR